MKKANFLSVVALSFFFALTLKSQTLTWVLAEQYSSGKWLYGTIESYSYNASQQLVSSNFRQFNFNTQSWDNIYRYTYTNNPQGLPTTMQREDWKMPQNSWTLSLKTETTYTFTNKILSETSSSWGGNAWQKYLQTNYNYNPSGGLIKTQINSWDPGTSSWLNGILYTYTVNASNNPERVLLQFWNDQSNAWDSNTSTSFSYTATKKIAIATVKVWLNNVWQTAKSTTNSFDFNDQLLSSTDKLWDSTNQVFVNNSKIEYTYLSNGKMSQSTSYQWSWSQQSWQPQVRYTYNYSGVPLSLVEPVKNSVNVYPNPCGNELFIDSRGINGYYNLMDMSGRIVKETWTSSGDNRINTSNLPGGVYILSGPGGKVRIVKE